MPAVDVAMARSLRGGVWGSIAESLQSSLAPRDTFGGIQDKAGEAVNAFSSWDACMEQSYCKWPVIAMIAIGGLILLSIVWCIVRCACCGLSCCCSCCHCLKCCGNCLGCCDPPKGKRHKYLDNETIPPNHGYRPEPPMKVPDFGPSRAVAPAPTHEAPQYAHFDMTAKKDEDSLPSMPTWESAGSKKIPADDAAVEMDQLNKPAHSGQSVASASAAAAASAAAVAAAAGGQRSPGMSHGTRSPYREPSPMGVNGYAAQDPYANNDRGHDAYGNGGGYRQAASPYGADQYGADQYGAVAAVPGGQMRASPPRHNTHNGYDQQQDYFQQHQAYDQHQGHSGSHMARGHAQTPQPVDPYAADPRRTPGPSAHDTGHMTRGHAQTPQPMGPYAAGPMNTPGPSAVAYGSERMGHSPAPPADRGYATPQYGQGAGYMQPDTEPRDALNNTAGFDFQSGYSRPQESNQQFGYDRQTSPVHQQPAGNGGYAAYSPYQPPQQQQQQQQQGGGW